MLNQLWKQTINLVVILGFNVGLYACNGSGGANQQSNDGSTIASSHAKAVSTVKVMTANRPSIVVYLSNPNRRIAHVGLGSWITMANNYGVNVHYVVNGIHPKFRSNLYLGFWDGYF